MDCIAWTLWSGQASLMRNLAIAGALVLAFACGSKVADPGSIGGPGMSGDGATPAPARAQNPLTDEELAGELAVARAGCARCHELPAGLPAGAVQRLAPIAGPSLATAARWHAADGGLEFLRRHHGGEAAPDLAAWVRSLGVGEPELGSSAVSSAAIARGETLFRQLACQGCHAPSALESLAARPDVMHVAAFLQHPAEHRPNTVHDFALDAGEAMALASWLLRSQASAEATAPVPGFAYECFEMQIDSAALPELDGKQPTAKGLATKLDVSVGTREDHFALRFTATLQVPADGEWKFTCGSDDSSWLWIDEELIVSNENIGPPRRRSGKVKLKAGPHALRVVFTEAAGGQVLEVLWSGPGVKEQAIPQTSASATSRAFVPPLALTAPDEAAVARGREQAQARRCASCHSFEGAPALAAAAKPFSSLGSGNCPQVQGAAAVRQAAVSGLAKVHDAAAELRFALLRDGCLACHVRNGSRGLPPVVKQGLAEVEDLGDEGRFPPDLTNVGHRLRTAWIEKVLAEGHKARPYLKVRMPRVSPEKAHRYAELFAAVDGLPGDDEEPPFSLEQAELGRQLAGVGGKNCVTCHTFAGKKALGPQGMNLGMQYERLRPAWFADWLLHAITLRPGTRMPLLWIGGDNDRREVDAIRTWLSLGASAPLPNGLATAAGLMLEPNDRPRLHGAFLKGLSARCIVVGSPLRTHYAYDIEHGRLAWLWRGGFIDASGTWSGRAGQLLEPGGTDWIVLDDLDFGAPGASAAMRRVLGRHMLPSGYPVFRVGVGDAEFEDVAVPRLVRGGSEIVRTLRCLRGPLQLDCSAQLRGTARLTVGGEPAAAKYTLQAGESLEVVYQW
jgi:mono/diheme cytochrome c family protein